MKKLIFILSIILFQESSLMSQSYDLDYTNPKEYILSGINISGARYLDKSSIISVSGLKIGDPIIVPGTQISESIKKLWNQNLFADISINIEKIDSNKIFLDIYLKEHEKLSKFKFTGNVSKNNISELKEQLSLMRGNTLSENLINNSIYKIKNYFQEKGFYNVAVSHEIQKDKKTINSSDLIFTINKGKKIKIEEIIFHGRKIRKNENKNLFNNKDSSYVLSDLSI